MKKIKKILAMVMAMAMIMGLGMTANAAEELPQTASITINKLTPNDNTTVKIYQVVSHNAQNSEWVAADWAQDYVKFPTQASAADINWAGLKEKVETDGITPTAEKTGINESTVTFDQLAAGAYLVIATGATTEYHVMGVATYKYDENSNLLAPLEAEIDAKGSSYTVTKTLNGQETLVNRGDELTFDIDSVFPSFAAETQNRSVTITDMPTGQYVKDVKVYVGDMNTALTLGEDYTLTFNSNSIELPAKENESVTVEFTDAFIGTNNDHAAEAIKVVVTTVVTDVTNIKNEATGSHDDSPATVVTETGSITIKKVDKAGNLLTGAKFSFTKDSDKTPLEFVKVADGVYKLATDADGDAERFIALEVGKEGTAKGILIVQGLGQGTYHIKEVEAPEGYSVVTVDDVELALGENANVEKPVVNTKLASLPGTGGIGTTLFTIGGIVIMVAAAALFFANRKKSDK